MLSEEQEVVLIPFSGGIDSFYIAHRELVKGNVVHTSYVEMFNNVTKTRAEKTLRSFWTQWLKEQFPDTYKDYPSVSQINASSIGHVYFLVQPVAWLALARPPVDYDRVVMGAIVADDPVSFKEEFTELFEALSKLTHNKSGCLDWSYAKTIKASIWQYVNLLSEKEGSVVDHRPWTNFWTCEMPVVEKLNALSKRTWKRHPHHPDILINTRQCKLAVTPKPRKDEEDFALVECGVCLKCNSERIRRNPKMPSVSKFTTPKRSEK